MANLEMENEFPVNDPIRSALDEAIVALSPAIFERLDTDAAAYLELVTIAAQAQTAGSGVLRDAVQSARSAGHSWQAIGACLGMTRQAAQQRFGAFSEVGVGAVRRVSPLTSFNEMRVLNAAGRYGWRSVGFGTLYHDMECTDEQWEHMRRIPGGRGQEETAGWEKIGSMWFPWAYYRRSLGVGAEKQPADFDAHFGPVVP